MEKIRLDIYVKNKLNISRTEAARLIEEGFVKKNGISVTKPSFPTNGDCIVIDKSGLSVYVGRGGLKLEKAIKMFKLDIKDKVCLDVGASTGGFTQCMLLAGAKQVYAVDVGSGQLARQLLTDPRVVSMEQTNILDIENLEHTPDFVTVDVSFVSITLILKKLSSLISPAAEGVFLIKPQFEAGKGAGKKGIVKDRKVHLRVLEDILAFTQNTGFSVKGLTPSPIKGGDGNIEYLMYVSKGKAENNLPYQRIKEIVAEAFTSLK